MFGASVRLVLFIFAYVLFKQCSAQSCSTTGRFSIYGTSCKYYIFCTYAGGVYYSTTYHCPGTTYFNPRSQRCVASFTCGDTFCAGAFDINSNALDFLDPNLSDNVSYIRCAFNGTDVIPIYLTCPFTFNISNPTKNSGCCPYVTC